MRLIDKEVAMYNIILKGSIVCGSDGQPYRYTLEEAQMILEICGRGEIVKAKERGNE